MFAGVSYITTMTKFRVNKLHERKVYSMVDKEEIDVFISRYHVSSASIDSILVYICEI
jgi:hypothetical protein